MLCHRYTHTCNTFENKSVPGDVPGLLWPNCPQLLDPHVYTLPSCNRNTECCPPQTASFRPLPLNTLQFLGSNIGFFSTPIPNCPSFAFPQHSMLKKRGGDEHQTEEAARQQYSDGGRQRIFRTDCSPVFSSSCNTQAWKNEKWVRNELLRHHSVFLTCTRLLSFMYGPLLFLRLE